MKNTNKSEKSGAEENPNELKEPEEPEEIDELKEKTNFIGKKLLQAKIVFSCCCYYLVLQFVLLIIFTLTTYITRDTIHTNDCMNNSNCSIGCGLCNAEIKADMIRMYTGEKLSKSIEIKGSFNVTTERSNYKSSNKWPCNYGKSKNGHRCAKLYFDKKGFCMTSFNYIKLCTEENIRKFVNIQINSDRFKNYWSKLSYYNTTSIKINNTETNRVQKQLTEKIEINVLITSIFMGIFLFPTIIFADKKLKMIGNLLTLIITSITFYFFMIDINKIIVGINEPETLSSDMYELRGEYTKQKNEFIIIGLMNVFIWVELIAHYISLINIQIKFDIINNNTTTKRTQLCKKMIYPFIIDTISKWTCIIPFIVITALFWVIGLICYLISGMTNQDIWTWSDALLNSYIKSFLFVYSLLIFQYIQLISWKFPSMAINILLPLLTEVIHTIIDLFTTN